MKNNNQTEKLLAEALEEKEQRIKELTGKVDTLTKENKVLNGKLKSLSEKPKESPTPQSMVTWEDHQTAIDAYVNKMEAMTQEIAELKSKNDKLCEERRYWATQQWAKHFFRWLFLKRHLWVWVVYGMFIAGGSIAVYINAEQRWEIQKLRSVEMKYRYLHATGTASDILFYLDDAYDNGDEKRLQKIHSIVKDYEQAIKHKADSIVRAEKKKLKEWE